MDVISKAKEIHQKGILIDSHLDLGGIILNRRLKGNKKILESVFYDDFNKASFNFIIAAIFVENDFLPEMALRRAMKQVNAIYEDIEESKEKFMLIKTAKDMDKALEENKIGIIMSLEGAEPVYNDLDLLNNFYRLGVRGLGITWSRRNFAADGSYFGDPEEGIKGGLTPFGIQLVRRAEELGMFLDVSHLNDPGLSDVLKYTKNPFIASHSNARALNNMTRNLTDEQIKAIGERKGVIGVNAYKGIVSKDDKHQDVSKLCDHIEHLVKIAGEDSVGFGFDLCSKYYENGEITDILKDHSESLWITEELLKREYTEDKIAKVIGGNYYKYLKNMFK